MFDRVLVAVDGSEPSLNAVRQVLLLAQAGSMRVLVVSVVPPYEGELRLVGVRNISSAMRGPYEKALSKSQEIANEYGVRAEFVLEDGEPHEVIPGLAEIEGCDLIVVGVTGFNPLEKVVLGSMAARIIGHSCIDVLTVPFPTIIGFDRLLVAVDGSNLGTKALQKGLGIQRAYGSQLFILAVADVPPHLYGVDPRTANAFVEATRKTLGECIEAIGIGEQEMEPILREGDPASTINEVARSKSVDLILMGSHGRSGLRRLLMGSVTERVISHAPCPVLVTTARNR